jgi:hypothetical protein
MHKGESVPMARSLDLDALTEDDMLQLLEEIFSHIPSDLVVDQ